MNITAGYPKPVNNRFWFNNYQDLFPIRENSFYQNEKETIPVFNLHFLRRSVKYFQLLPVEDVFKL